MSELFLGIFNTAITAGWLVLAVLAARLLLKKAPAWVKCALWAIVALRLVWPFEIESLLSLIPSSQTVPPAQLYSPMPQIDTGIPVINAVINPVFTQTFTPEPSNSVNPLQVVTIVAAWVWVAGMVAMALYTAISYFRLKKQVRVRMPVEKGVYLSDGVDTPFILGVFRPKIYLPSDLSREKWNSILAHERAHLARKDHWWKPLGFLLLTAFWFHPLLWVAYWLLCRDVEMACDEKVIEKLSTEEKKTYSEVLLSCSMPRKWISACPLAFGETGVKGRIKAVLHYKKPTLWIIVAALLVGSILAVCFLTEPKDTTDESKIYSAAGMHYQLQYGDSMVDTLTITVSADGSFTYYENMASSYIGRGTWYQEGNKLYLTDTGIRASKYVFLVEADGIRFVAAESTDNFYWAHLHNDTKIPGTKLPDVEQLIFVEITTVVEDGFYGVDRKGNDWYVKYKGDIPEDMTQCLVTYLGEPKTNEQGGWNVTAKDCWLYKEDIPKAGGRVYDTVSYDIDGDDVKEECIISENITGKIFTCKLSVWDGDVCEYEVCFNELLVPDENSFGSIPTEDTEIPAPYPYANVYAFVLSDGNLMIATPSLDVYISTGQLTTFQVKFTDGELTVA